MAAATSEPLLSQNATKAEALAYLKKYWGGVTYHNDAKSPYEGMNYAKLYAYFAKKDPAATPYQIAKATADVLLTSALATTVGGVVTGTGNATAEIATGTVGGLDQFAASLSGPFAILGDLTSANLWIRVGKVLFGGILLTVGIIELTGQSGNIKGAAGKAVKAAPFLL